MDPVQNNTPAVSDKPFVDLQKPGPKPLKGKVVRGPGQVGDEAQQLRKAAKDFEAVFMAEVLKGMRETVHKEDMFHGGPGEDMFEGLLDDEVAKRIAGQGSMGVGEMLYRDLSIRHHIGEEKDAKGPVDTRLKKFLPLHPPSDGSAEKPGSSTALRKGFLPLKPNPKAGSEAPQAPPAVGGATDVEAQIRKLRQQGLGLEGATIKR